MTIINPCRKLNWPFLPPATTSSYQWRHPPGLDDKIHIVLNWNFYFFSALVCAWQNGTGPILRWATIVIRGQCCIGLLCQNVYYGKTPFGSRTRLHTWQTLWFNIEQYVVGCFLLTFNLKWSSLPKHLQINSLCRPECTASCWNLGS